MESSSSPPSEDEEPIAETRDNDIEISTLEDNSESPMPASQDDLNRPGDIEQPLPMDQLPDKPSPAIAVDFNGIVGGLNHESAVAEGVTDLSQTHQEGTEIPSETNADTSATENSNVPNNGAPSVDRSRSQTEALQAATFAGAQSSEFEASSYAGNSIILAPSSQRSFERLVSLGYNEQEAIKALRVAGNDLDQAIGFLMMDEASKADFVTDSTRSSSAPREAERASSIIRSQKHAYAPPGSPQDTKPGFVQVDSADLLVQMGYDREQARVALAASRGNMDRAVEILTLPDASRWLETYEQNQLLPSAQVRLATVDAHDDVIPGRSALPPEARRKLLIIFTGGVVLLAVIVILTVLLTKDSKKSTYPPK